MAVTKKILGMLVMACLLAGCGHNCPVVPEDPSSASFDVETVYISADAGQAQAVLSASGAWLVKDAPEWLGYVRPSSGVDGNTTLTFGGRFYNGSEDRSGMVVVNCGKTHASITVVQRAVQHISLTPSSVEAFPSEGGVVSVIVDADFVYEVDLGDASGWMGIDSASEREVVFMVDPNEGDERSADVRFRDASTGYEAVFSLVQQGSEPFLERRSLMDLYLATQGSGWNRSDGWNSETPLSSWYGVTVDELGRVVELDLSSNNLVGELPKSIIYLKHLRKLYLYNNRLGGSLPEGMRLMEGWSSFAVEKYLYPQLDGCVFTSSDSEVVQYCRSSKPKAIDIVILGDAYTAPDLVLGKGFDAIVQRTIEALFDIEPMKGCKDYFNVYAVSAESVSRTIGTSEGNTAFGTYFTSGLGVTMTTSWQKVFSYAGKAPVSDISNTLVILLANTTRFGGCTLSWDDGSQISIIPDYPAGQENKYGFEGLVHHEAVGHGLGKLDEEYHYSNNTAPEDFATYLAGKHAIGVSLNISATPDPVKVPWAELIGKTGFEQIGVFEGAYLYTYGAYRSEKNCCMDDNQPYFGAWCDYLIWKRIRSLAGETNTLNDYLSR